jgi:hypothetical protein
MAGKLVLINVVLSSLPTYFMSTLILSKLVVQKIDAIRRLLRGSDINTTTTTTKPLIPNKLG